MYQKIWDSHLVKESHGDICIIYVDRQLVHEVTSPQAFEGLRLSGRKVRHPENTFATMDHNTSTKTKELSDMEETSQIQINALANNCKEFGVNLYDHLHPDNGVVHIFAPELGITQPGMVIVCGDSHTATHGAFGSSKTQLGLQLAVNVQLPKEKGGLEGKVIFIDTESTFRPAKPFEDNANKCKR